MTKKGLIIIGSSGHAKVVLDIFEKMNQHHIIGYIDNHKAIGEKVLDYPVLGTEEILSNYDAAETELFIAIGDNWVRHLVKMRIDENFPAFSYATAIHPSAQIGKDVVIGQGSAIMAGVVINPSCIISSFCLLNTRSSFDHDSRMYDFSSLAPGATTGGNVHIGEYASVGIGASIMHGVKVGNHAVIGGLSFVNKDVDEMTVCYGTPARSIRKREKGEKYL